MKKAGNLPALPPVLAPWQHRRTPSTKQFFPSAPTNARFIAPAGLDLLALLTPTLEDGIAGPCHHTGHPPSVSEVGTGPMKEGDKPDYPRGH